jgi:hypothetical protein
MKVTVMNPMPVMSARFAVGDVILWGKLVKMWATQKAYDGVPVMPQPLDLKELQEQCDKIKLKITIPGHIKALALLNHSEEVLFLRVPPRSLVENSEAFLKDPRTDYPHMPIYDLFEKFTGPDDKILKDKKLDFHAARVGDYSIAKCC